jgi:hypothetical protein
VTLRNRNPKPGATNHDGDDVVELTRVTFIGEAIAIKQDLARIGVVATVFESDGGGWAPYLAINSGNRVMVCARDLARATQLLSANGGQLPAEPVPSFPPVTKHLRHHDPS